MKFCVHCGEQIDAECVVCPKCGRQVKDLAQAAPATPSITINNSSNSSNVNTNRNSATATATAVAGSRRGRPRGRRVNKMVALMLCIFAGYVGAHKFYEGKTAMGVLYIFTGGLLLIGWITDCIAIAKKPGEYYYVDDGRQGRYYD